jgi:hypothetical protein
MPAAAVTLANVLFHGLSDAPLTILASALTIALVWRGGDGSAQPLPDVH